MKHRSWAGIVAGLAWALWACSAAVPAWAASEAAFQKAFEAFNRASAGDAPAVEEAAGAFEALRTAEPSNPVLLAYSGASLAMKAGTTSMPWKKMGYAEDGLAEIDKALAMLAPVHDAAVQHATPGTLEVKFVAASTFLAVPDFMNRGPRGKKLLGDVLASPLFDPAPLPFKGQVWMRAAALAAKERRSADARRFLDEVIRHGAPQAEAARSRLKEIGA